MILKLQVVVIGEDGHQETCEIASVERRDLKPETLGLTLAEGKAILKGIQQIVIERQASTCLASYRGCRRTSKGYHDLSVRTVFGCLKVKSPRLHHCDCRSHERRLSAPWRSCFRSTPRRSCFSWKPNFADEPWDDGAVDGGRAAHG